MPVPHRIVERVQENHDTVSLSLARASQAPTFLPGQFGMLYAFGVGEVPISISGDPLQPERLVHTVRAVGAVTRALCALRPGAMVGYRGPFGNAWPFAAALQPPGRELILIGGGVGLAPLRAAINQALAQRDAFSRVCVLIGARTRADLLFAGAYDAWRAAGAEVYVTLDLADRDWQGHVGVVTRLIPLADINPHRALAWVCGPEIMMRFAIHALLDAGLPEPSIHLTMERNMKCAVGLCGRCQFGADFLCKDGPIFAYDRVKARLSIQGL